MFAVCLACRTTIPDASCSIYREKAVPASDWEKVVGWARFMQIILNKEVRLKQQQEQQKLPAAEEAVMPAQRQPSPASECKLKPIRFVRTPPQCLVPQVPHAAAQLSGPLNDKSSAALLIQPGLRSVTAS